MPKYDISTQHLDFDLYNKRFQLQPGGGTTIHQSIPRRISFLMVVKRPMLPIGSLIKTRGEIPVPQQQERKARFAYQLKND